LILLANTRHIRGGYCLARVAGQAALGQVETGRDFSARSRAQEEKDSRPTLSKTTFFHSPILMLPNWRALEQDGFH
jgi:hypothetical protein